MASGEIPDVHVPIEDVVVPPCPACLSLVRPLTAYLFLCPRCRAVHTLRRHCVTGATYLRDVSDGVDMEMVRQRLLDDVLNLADEVHRMHEYAREIRDTVGAMDLKAAPQSVDGEWVHHYIFPAGVWHRVLGLVRSGRGDGNYNLGRGRTP